MSPEQQVIQMTPTYSPVELILIGLALAAMVVLPTLSGMGIIGRKAKRKPRTRRAAGRNLRQAIDRLKESVLNETGFRKVLDWMAKVLPAKAREEKKNG